MQKAVPRCVARNLRQHAPTPIHKPETTTLKRRYVKMSTKPTHEQAQLQLQVYDQRREAKLRQARDWFTHNYFADNYRDALRIAAPGTEGGTYFMMVVGYWEQ